MPEIKFCGLTRPADADYAVGLGASYVGVIFAGGPRLLAVSRAAEVLSGVPGSVQRVGVFGDQTPDEIADIAARLSLSVVQLHGTADLARLGRVLALEEDGNGLTLDRRGLFVAEGGERLEDRWREAEVGETATG